jgi:hypothetical protein
MAKAIQAATSAKLLTEPLILAKIVGRPPANIRLRQLWGVNFANRGWT